MGAPSPRDLTVGIGVQAELSGIASIHMNIKDFLPDRLAEGTAWIADTAERYNKYVTGALGLPLLMRGGAGC